MKGKVIAVANMKGGVGKTATVVALAESLAAAEGARVLVIDLDAQANASIVLAGDSNLAAMIRDGRTIDAFLEDYLMRGKKKKFDSCIRDQISEVTHLGQPLQVSLLASSAELRTLELRMIYKLTKKKELNLEEIVGGIWGVIKEQLSRSAKSFDYILIDCAPGISVLTEASIRLADLVIVPTIPDTLSTYGLQAFCKTVWQGQSETAKFYKKPRGRLPHVLITRRRPVVEHNRTVERMRNEMHADDPSFSVFETEIPERAAIADALAMTGTHPNFTNKWTPAVADILQRLARETKETLNGSHH